MGARIDSFKGALQDKVANLAQKGVFGTLDFLTEHTGPDSLVQNVLIRIDETVRKVKEMAELAGQTKEEAALLAERIYQEVINLILDRHLELREAELLFCSVMNDERYDVIPNEQKELLDELGVPKIYYEMLQGIRTIQDMPKHGQKMGRLSGKIKRHVAMDDVDKNTRKPRLFITGEGSSIAIPGYLASALGEKLHINNMQIVNERCGEVGEVEKEDVVVVMSNSGKTGPAVELAQRAKEAGAIVIGITQEKKSPLAEICGDKNTIILNCGKEDAVGATKSVVEQCCVVSDLVSRLGGQKMENWEKVAEKFARALTDDVSPEMVREISKARELVVIGWHGVHREMLLKVAETIGVTVRVIDRPDALHGMEETLKVGDVIICLEPHMEKMEDLEEKLASRVPVYYLGSNPGILEEVSADRVLLTENIENFQPLINLGRVQRLLIGLAIYKGSNCEPRFARKVGDEVKGA